MAIDKGMPIEQVQKLLGHIKIDVEWKIMYNIVEKWYKYFHNDFV
mgnify:CR=1 FL=1